VGREAPSRGTRERNRERGRRRLASGYVGREAPSRGTRERNRSSRSALASLARVGAGAGAIAGEREFLVGVGCRSARQKGVTRRLVGVSCRAERQERVTRRLVGVNCRAERQKWSTRFFVALRVARHHTRDRAAERGRGRGLARDSDRTAVLGGVEAGAVLAVLAMLGGRFAPACAWLRAAARGAKSLRDLAASTPPARGGRGHLPARWVRASAEELVMLRIYPVLLELIRSLRPLVKELGRHDRKLAEQCVTALASAPLNVAEGSYSRGRNRAARCSGRWSSWWVGTERGAAPGFGSAPGPRGRLTLVDPYRYDLSCSSSRLVPGSG
jgi:hypothetical protein